MNIAYQQTEVPLNKLAVWIGNVRKTGVEQGIDELSASIAAVGLINPLTVQKGKKGKFEVISGQRRLLALQRLAEEGRLDKAFDVPCHVKPEKQDAAELSLAENVVRIAMHPADQFEAWHRLAEAGASVETIAARFGTSEATVRKRLVLGRVSPRLMGLYREGALELEALQAFTLTDNHALQEQVWDSLPTWQRSSSGIRRALTETDIPATDKRVRLVGLDAYEAAGGPVRRDLFDNRNSGYVLDVAILDRMVQEKLEAATETVRAEGWAWVETRLEFDMWDRQEFEQAEPEQHISEALQAEYDALREEIDRLNDAGHDSEEAEDAANDRIEAAEARLREIDQSTRFWSEAVMATTGAIVSLTYDGKVDIERGITREETTADDDEELGGEEPAPDKASAPKAAALPASLVEDLSAQKTAALRVELARRPDIALAFVVHALAVSLFSHSGSGVLKLRLTTRRLPSAIKEQETCAALRAHEAETERVGDRLPGESEALLDWCLQASRDDLLDVLAVLASHGVDAVESKADANRGGAGEGTALANALGLDMTQWYRPTAAGYFSRISKDLILADLAEAGQGETAPAWAKLKKAELATFAERETAKTQWLPKPLR